MSEQALDFHLQMADDHEQQLFERQQEMSYDYDKEAPKKGDYIMLLDAEDNPSENHAEVSSWFSCFGYELYGVFDTQGEEWMIARNENLDTDERRGWEQVVNNMGYGSNGNPKEKEK